MPFIPIRTETPIRRTPVANIALILANILLFALLDAAATPAIRAWKDEHFILNTEWPRWYQFLTYQFAHGDIWHLAGNMLFLWVFGNSVNAKMRNLPYLLFYLGGGVFAGLMFGLFDKASLLGASGAIAAVTTAYLVLFPRSRVLVLYLLFFVGMIEVPAILLILLKIILWDNVLAPQLHGGATQVAHSAHLAGYAFGFVVAMIMLLLRAVPRDQFDCLSLMKRWNQRRAYRSLTDSPEAKAKVQYGRVARARPISNAEKEKLDEVADRRAHIADLVTQGQIEQAASVYQELTSIDDRQCLPESQQITIARWFYANGRHPQAAAAFERFLDSYRQSNQANEVRLLLGIILARDLKQYDAAESHLAEAVRRAVTSDRRAQAERWLEDVRSLRQKPA